MISSELEIALLVLAFYASTCAVLVFANEGVLARASQGLRLRVADDRIRIVGRSPIWLNPFTPMFPAFRVQWGNADAIAASPGLPSPVAEAMRASEVLTPYVFAVFLYAIIGIPLALLWGGGVRALPIVALAYLAAVVMLVRLWFLRDAFSLSRGKFALLAFESLVCLPFSAGVVRRLSLLVPVREDLASFTVDMRAVARARALATLVEHCDEMAGFHPESSAEHTRLMRYRARLALLTGASPAGTASADTADHPGEIEKVDGRK
jgi:hypothetical protein